MNNVRGTYVGLLILTTLILIMAFIWCADQYVAKDDRSIRPNLNISDSSSHRPSDDDLYNASIDQDADPRLEVNAPKSRKISVLESKSVGDNKNNTSKPLILREYAKLIETQSREASDLVDDIQDSFEREAVDFSWARSVEDEIINFIYSDEVLSTVSLEGVKCKSTICLAEVPIYDDGSDFNFDELRRKSEYEFSDIARAIIKKMLQIRENDASLAKMNFYIKWNPDEQKLGAFFFKGEDERL